MFDNLLKAYTADDDDGTENPPAGVTSTSQVPAQGVFEGAVVDDHGKCSI